MVGGLEAPAVGDQVALEVQEALGVLVVGGLEAPVVGGQAGMEALAGQDLGIPVIPGIRRVRRILTLIRGGVAFTRSIRAPGLIRITGRKTQSEVARALQQEPFAAKLLYTGVWMAKAFVLWRSCYCVSNAG